MTNNSIRLAILCTTAPPPEHNGTATEFGLQDKHKVLQPGVPAADGALRFVCEVTAKPRQSGEPDFGGPYVHGPLGGRFLYLGWRPPGGAWIRRWKLPLAAISWKQIYAVEALPDGALVARVEIGARVTPEVVWAAAIEN